MEKVETKITHKTIAHYGSMISTGKVNIYESFNTGSGVGSTRESRTISDSQIDDITKSRQMSLLFLFIVHFLLPLSLNAQMFEMRFVFIYLLSEVLVHIGQ